MKQIIFFAFSFLFSALLLPAQTGSVPEIKSYTIGGITIEGCEYTQQEAILSYTGLDVGDQIEVPGQSIPLAIKRLWEKKVFSDVAIEADNIIGKKIFLLIKVTERPRISTFSFAKGVTNSQADDLRERIGFIRMSMWTKEKERDAERKIRNYFIEKGYWNTKVNFLSQDDPDVKKGIRLKIVVDKGPKIKVNEIKIDGNQDFSDTRLKRKMKAVKEKRWWRVWSRSKYIPAKMKEAKTNLITFYHQNAYRDAEVVMDTVYRYDDKSVDVELKVLEGNQYYIRNIEFIGNYKYKDDSLLRVLGIESGDPYNTELLEQKLRGDMTGRDVSSLYLDDGHLFFNVTPVEVAVVGDSVDLELRMYEGPQARYKDIIVEGNTKTSDFVILREVRTLPGAKFSRSDLIRSHREILNLGYFNQENLQVIPEPDPVNGTVNIRYIVEEKPSDQLQIQGGWGGRITDQNGDVIGGGFVGTVQLGFNNFSTRKFFKKGSWRPIPSGDGQKLNLAVQMNGIGWQNYSISFLEPWLGGKKPNSLGASVYYTINQSPQTGFRMKTLGGSLDYGIRLRWPDDFFRTYTSLAYKYYDIQNGAVAFSALNFNDAFINIVSIKQTIDRTSIDAPIYPRSGSQISLSLEMTPPFSLFNRNKDYASLPDAEKFNLLEYYKWKFNSTWYFQIAKNLVLKPRVQYGFLGAYNQDYGVPPFERFYLGGSGLGQFNFYGWEYIGLRGYPDNAIGPRAAEASFNSLPIGGNIYNKYSLELRYPISLNQAAPIWVLGFAEAGNAWLGVENYNPFDLKRAAGVGVRVMLPMVGLLGVDWGYGFDKIAPDAPGPHGTQFTFIIGQEF